MRSVLTFFLCFFALPAISQTYTQPDGGGSADMFLKTEDELTPQQRAAIISMLQENEKKLRTQGKLAPASKTMLTAFQWPLRQSAGFNDNGYYGISNFVDHNPAYPNLVRDYNCGARTYDQSSGYNHKGIDIFTWPFPWQKMNTNAVEIIAAAAGTIIAKTDGNTDQNCAFCSGPCNWNAVYVMHADGSIAWYGHMKLNSLTSKGVGATVTAGEYLGIVGSSGNSTGPHLHLEVYTNNTYTQLVDPYAGPCNSLNGNISWWANQEPYYVSTLNKIMTHSTAPVSSQCPAGEAVNPKINFVSGETVYFGSYYRDQRAGQESIHKLYRPDGSVYQTWIQNFTNNYNASWWYYFISLPNPAPTGMWRYEIIYNSQAPLATYFAVNTIGYSFMGTGDWNVATNWTNNAMPPTTLPTTHEIVINPIAGDECVLNQSQTIASGAKLTVAPGKVFRVAGNLINQ